MFQQNEIHGLIPLIALLPEHLSIFPIADWNIKVSQQRLSDDYPAVGGSAVHWDRNSIDVYSTSTPLKQLVADHQTR